MATVPIIDISPLFEDYSSESARAAAENALASKFGAAAEEIGFIVVTGHHVDANVVDNAWNSVRAFFDLPLADKKQYMIVNQEVNPFGYSPLGEEVLSSGKSVETGQAIIATPDLKEMYSMGPENPLAGFPPRSLPTQGTVAHDLQTYYSSLNQLAETILRLFAISLKLSPDFFEAYCTRHASALRCINYPEIPAAHTVLPGQCRASAHTDYGTITILRADGPGLQVSKDRTDVRWVDVPVVADGFIINLGDLMRRWTNDRYASTLHRVIVDGDADGNKRRQSMAFFHNINRDAVVSSLGEDEAKYPPIVAGDFLMQKHLASIGKR